MAQHSRLQPGQPVAAVGAAEEDRQLVAHQLAATAGEDGRKAGETRSVLLAPTGGEPPDAAAVWGHPRQDHSVALSSRIGEPMPGSDFGDERGRGAAKCRDHRLERRQFTAVEASGKVEQVAHALAESLNGQNPTGRLHSEALRHMLWAVPKLKMEIPVESGSTNKSHELPSLECLIAVERSSEARTIRL